MKPPSLAGLRPSLFSCLDTSLSGPLHPFKHSRPLIYNLMLCHVQVYTDNIHVHDKIGANIKSPECMSEAVKRLKPRLLQRIIDVHNMDQCLIFCRTNFDCDNLEKFLNELGRGRGQAFRWANSAVVVQLHHMLRAALGESRTLGS